MSGVRQLYENKGLSREATSILMSSWRTSTQRQYQPYIRKWNAYTTERNVDRISPPAVAVVEFLTELFTSGLGYSALNTARSALSTMVSCSGVAVGKHPLIIRFLKGVFQLRPALPRNNVVWDTDTVLQYLKTLSPVR